MLGKVIQGTLSQNQAIITERYMQNIKYRLGGVLCACSRPISIYNLLKEENIEDKLGLQIIEELIKNENIKGYPSI